MKEHNWAAVCIQETWRLGADDFYIDGHRVLLQGPSKKINKLGHVMGGVCIILNPEMDAAHKLALNKKINLPNDHKYEGGFLGIQLHFKQRDSHGKRIKGIIKTIRCSIYHPVDSSEHKEFNGITQTLLNRLPNDTQMIFGQDINCDVGTTNDKNNPLRSTLGPHGINNRNIKGARFLQHLCSLDMKLANSSSSNQTTPHGKNSDHREGGWHAWQLYRATSAAVHLAWFTKKRGHIKMKAGRSSYVIELDKIYSPGLIVPNYFTAGTATSITVNEIPQGHRIIVPISMIKEHVDCVDVRATPIDNEEGITAGF